jgi:NAD(P) transhydrogenase subunit alpha
MLRSKGYANTVAVLKESRPHENLVAIVPAVADKLTKLGCILCLMRDAGLASKYRGSAFQQYSVC